MPRLPADRRLHNILPMKNLFTTFLLITIMSQAYPQDGHEKFIYKHNIRELHRLYAEKHIENARKASREMDSVIFNGPYKANYESLSLHPTPEWFMDAKFGIAINYSLYSIVGAGEQGYGGNYYTDIYLNSMYGSMRPYHIENWGEDFERDDFIPLFKAKHLDTEGYVALFKEIGARYFAVFLNHRSTGMLLWDSDYTFRDSKDMLPHRDLAGEFRAACEKNDLPFCAYFNLEDTDYPIVDRETDEIYIREWTPIDPGQTADNGSYEVFHRYDPVKEERRLQGKVPVYDYVDDYLLPISKELIDKYEPEYIWYDGGWKRPAWYYKSHKMTAYFYNKYEGEKEVMVNSRMGTDLYGELGDVVISEGGNVDGAEYSDYWEEISPMGRNFAYDRGESDQNVPPSSDLIRMLIRIVASGGNFLLVVAPDGEGRIPDYQRKRLDEMGKWLAVNGEAIYETRPHPWYREEDKFGYITYYTRSKDEKFSYAIVSKLRGNRLILYNATAKEGTEIRLLGYDKKIEWFNSRWGLNIHLTEDLLKNLPCSHFWVFRFEEDEQVEYQLQQSE